MRFVFILSYVAKMVLTTVSLSALSEQAAIHFRPGGFGTSRQVGDALPAAGHTVAILGSPWFIWGMVDLTPHPSFLRGPR